MRQSVKEFVKICADTFFIPEPICEFGSLQVPGQVGIADLRPLFPNKKYVGADMREGPSVDVILNLHNIDLPTESVGTVLMLEILEHVEFLWKAIEEIYRILKPDGFLIMSSVMNLPIHGYPNDYWRFTPEAFRSLLKPFVLSFVEYTGRSGFPDNILGIGFKSAIAEDELRQFDMRLQSWRKYWRHLLRRNLKELVKPFTPQILFEIYRKTRGV